MLALCSAIDLNEVGGCIPFYWGLFKSLNYYGVNIVVIPFNGKGIRTLWWASEENPIKPNLIDKIHDKIISKVTVIRNISVNTSIYTKGKTNFNIVKFFFKRLDNVYFDFRWHTWQRLWLKKIETLLRKGDFDIIAFFAPPIRQSKTVIRYIRKNFKVPIVLYEADFPTYLYNESFFKSSKYYSVDLNDFDLIIVNSEGVIPKLRELGAEKVQVVDFGVDPSWLSIPPVLKDVDVSFFGYDSYLRESYIQELITIPSIKLPARRFAVAGNRFYVNLGKADFVGRLNIDKMKLLSARSKINLNITRKTFAETYASSTARLFELAAMGACIVSNPCKGMEKWFQPGKEIFIANNSIEAMELYEWLLNSDETRLKAASLAKRRTLKEHTYDKRAKEFLEALRRII